MPDSVMRSNYVMAGGVRTHYTEAGGDGPPVVLCHGAGPGSSGEAGFARIIPALAQKFRVYALDSVGGFGDTDPEAPTPEGFQNRVDHLADFMDTLCLDQVCISGNSQGAWVAARYALDHPSRVRKMVLVGSNTIASAMGLKVPETEGARALAAYDGTEAAMRRFMNAVVYNTSIVSDELVKLRTEAANRPGGREALARFQAGSRHFRSDANLKLKFDLSYSLPKLTIPTKFLWGANDEYAPVELAKQLETLLPNVPFEYIPEAGHQAQTDQPELVARQLVDFFSD